MENKIIWTYCNACEKNTKQTILSVKTIYSNGEDDYPYTEHFQIMQCNGCEEVSFRKEFHDHYSFYEDEEGNATYDITIDTYPTLLKNHKPLSSTRALPAQIRTVYEQTILAFRGKSFLLTGVGFRAIIEAICLAEKISGKNLEKKINNLVQHKYITEKESERLHSIRFLGNDSVHEMEVPDERKLYLVLNIVEHLLKNLYLIDREAKFVLDTIVKEFADFEELLWQCANKLKVDEEKALKGILGKHIRRISVDIATLETVLIDQINKGELEFLKLGEIKQAGTEMINQQHYIFTNKRGDDLPF